jgi:hypothetical protein
MSSRKCCDTGPGREPMKTFWYVVPMAAAVCSFVYLLAGLGSAGLIFIVAKMLRN